MDPPINEKIIGKWKAVRDLAVCVPPEMADVQSEAQKRAADLCEKAEAIRKRLAKFCGFWRLTMATKLRTSFR